MRWEEWKPTYLEIAALLKLDQQSDWKATELLTHLLRNSSPEPLISKLSKLIRNHIIVVCGAGPSLESHLIAAKFNPSFEDAVYIAADGATSAFVELGYNCDIIVTDLDGDLDKIKHAVTCGALPVVHAHGDNMNIIKELVPTLPNVLGSTQVEPTERAFLWGGFTDGDRACYLAEHYAPKQIVLAGMDFGDTVGRWSKPNQPNSFPADEKKKKKLEIAENLIRQLMHQGDIEYIFMNEET